MSSTKTKATTWPYAYKTIAMYCSAVAYTIPYRVTVGMPAVATSEMALEIFPPLYIYKPAQLFMHLNYTFNSSIASADQVLLGIYVRDTPSSFVRTGGSSVQNFMPLNIQADVNRNINVSLDLTSLLTGLPTNVVFLVFNSNCSAPARVAMGDTINVWKLDLTYQTIGVRNEK